MKKIITLLVLSMSLWVSAQCPTVDIYYPSPLCQSASPRGVSMSGTGAYYGGSFYAMPNGLTLDSATGTITPSTSTPGNYTVNYTTPSGSCSPVTTSTYVTINANPTATPTPTTQTICSGQTTGIVLTSNISGTSFSWTCSISGVSGASAGTGNFISQTLTTTGSSLGTVDYTITPVANGCSGASITVTVTVTPAPVASATPNGETICSGETTNIVLSSNVPGTTFQWNCVSNGLTGTAAGSGDVIQQTLINVNGSYPGNSTYIVTPYVNGCPGNYFTVYVIVNPLPEVYASAPLFILSGESPTIALTSNVSGATYSWTASQNGVTGASSGTANTIDQILTTTGILPGTVTYTITPIANGCYGSPITITVTVLYVPGLVDGTIGTDGVGNVIQPYLLDTLLSDGRYTCEWTFNGAVLRGVADVNAVTTNQYSATQAGRYCVVAVNNTTGFRSLEACADVTTQVLSNSSFNNIQLTYSPNPVTDVLTIQSKELLKKVTVYNTLGQMVYSNVLNDLNPQIELSKLVSGNYFVKVEAKNKQNVFQVIKK